MRKVLALCVTASVLALAACGSGSSTSLDSIDVKPGADANSEPQVSIDAPLLTDKSEASVLVEGDGAEIKDGQTISLKSGIYKNIDGLQTDSNFTGDAVDMKVDDSMKSQMPELYDTLIGAKVGSWIAYTTVDGNAQADGSVSEPAEGARAERIIVMNIQNASDPSTTLGKDEVDSLKKDGKLPTVDTGGDTPKISIPKDTEAPAGLAVDVLEEGKGAKATETSDAQVKYTGVTWSDGKEFDGNFDSDDAASFNLANVIAGWTQGLNGLKEGSKVLLTVPADMAYGNAASSGQPSGTLVFYVELNKVSDAAG